MALIPYCVGVVKEIKKIEELWYKSEVTIDVNGPKYGICANGLNKFKSGIPVEELGFQVGDKVSTIAFELTEDKCWESEGFKKLDD